MDKRVIQSTDKGRFVCWETLRFSRVNQIKRDIAWIYR